MQRRAPDAVERRLHGAVLHFCVHLHQQSLCSQLQMHFWLEWKQLWINWVLQFQNRGWKCTSIFPQNMNEGSLKILNDLEEHHAEPHILAFSSTSSTHVCPTAACQCSLLLGAVHPAYWPSRGIQIAWQEYRWFSVAAIIRNSRVVEICVAASTRALLKLFSTTLQFPRQGYPHTGDKCHIPLQPPGLI